MEEINKNLMRVLQVDQQVKAVTASCETCGGPHSYNDCPAIVGQTYNVYAAGAYQGGNSYQPQGYRNLLSYRSDNYLRPPRGTTKEETNSSKELVMVKTRLASSLSGTGLLGLGLPSSGSSTLDSSTMNTASSSGLKTHLSNTITNPKEDLKVERATEVTKDTVPPTNNERTKDVQPLVVHIETPIPNSKPVVTPIIEPVAAPVSAPKPNQKPSILVAEDVFVKVGKFHFLADFVVVDFDADPRVPLILVRSLKTRKALIKVYEGELTLRIGKESITFNLDQTSRYSANYNGMTANQIKVIDMDCEEYSQEVLGFFDVISSGNLTPYYDLIVSTSSLTLTHFGDSDFLLEEVDAFLALEDDPTLLEFDHSYFDMEGDILLLKAFLNDDPSLPPPTQGKYLP
nr:reverse transcriptase domain-containing protein [Tanacetum cinerariifolium]